MSEQRPTLVERLRGIGWKTPSAQEAADRIEELEAHIVHLESDIAERNRKLKLLEKALKERQQ